MPILVCMEELFCYEEVKPPHEEMSCWDWGVLGHGQQVETRHACSEESFLRLFANFRWGCSEVPAQPKTSCSFFKILTWRGGRHRKLDIHQSCSFGKHLRLNDLKSILSSSWNTCPLLGDDAVSDNKLHALRRLHIESEIFLNHDDTS